MSPTLLQPFSSSSAQPSSLVSSKPSNYLNESSKMPGDDRKTTLIQAVRQSVLEEAKKCPNDIYTEDLPRFEKSDLQIKRFIVRVRAQDEKDIVKNSVEVIMKNLRWRKEVRIRERTEETFPLEFFDVGLIGVADEPKSGKKMLYINCKAYRRQPDLTHHFWAFGNTLFERIDRELNGKRMILFLDLSQLSLVNADINFLRYYLSLLTFEFPLSLEQTYIYEPPWYIKHLVSLGLALFPKKLVRNVCLLDRSQAVEKFGVEGIPIGAGGQLDTHIPPPKNCPSSEEFAKLHAIPYHIIEKAKKDYGLI